MPVLEKFYFKKKGTVAPLEFLTEPVVHSTKWVTGSRLLPCFAPFSQVLTELVVHSTEWATGSRLLRPFKSSPKSCVKICRLSYSLFAFGEVDKEGALISLPGIV